MYSDFRGLTVAQPPWEVQWSRTERACVDGQNIQLFNDKSVSECEQICLSFEKCVGFEYGMAYGGSSGSYQPRDCQPQSSTDTSGCDGTGYNLDFYERTTGNVASLYARELVVYGMLSLDAHALVTATTIQVYGGVSTAEHSLLGVVP